MTFWLDLLILFYFLSLNTIYTVLMFLSILEILRRQATRMPEFDPVTLSDTNTPPITIIAPAYNEAKGIVDSTRAFLQLDYPNLQIIVVNDGSDDDTLARLKARFELAPIDLVVRNNVPSKPIRVIYQSAIDPRLWVVDKENGGKADALNVGLNVCRTPLVSCVDADTLIDRRALLRMVEPFLYDERLTVAVGGTVRLANGCKVKDGVVEEARLPASWLARFQVLEYLRAFLFGRMGFNRLGGNLIISGAFGLFRRDAVVEVGGFHADTVGEDMDLVVRMHRTLRERKEKYKVLYIPDPVAFTEAPESIGVLRKQRDRWHRGLAETMWKHRGMFLNPRYGAIGLFVYPIYLFVELFGPIIELLGYGYFIFLLATRGFDSTFVVLFFLVSYLWGFILSAQGVILDEAICKLYHGVRVRLQLLLVAVLENVGFRQMTLAFRWLGFLSFIVGRRAWGTMRRKGFARASA